MHVSYSAYFYEMEETSVEKEKVIKVDFAERRAEEELKKGFAEAETLLKDEDKLERMLQRLEIKLKSIPKIGGHLASVPTMISLVRSYMIKEYPDLPIGTVVAVVSALAYFVSPIDLIPDTIPGIGHLDDALVIAACLQLVNSDIEEYVKWREENGKSIEH